LILARLACAQRVIAVVHHLARDARHLEDRRGHAALQPAEHEARKREARHHHHAEDREIVEHAVPRQVARADVDGSERLAALDHAPEDHDLVSADVVAVHLGAHRKRLRRLALLEIGREEPSRVGVDRRREHLLARTDDAQVLLRRLVVVEREGRRARAREDLRLEVEIVGPLALVSAQVVGDEPGGAQQQRRGRRDEHEQHDLAADRGAHAPQHHAPFCSTRRATESMRELMRCPLRWAASSETSKPTWSFATTKLIVLPADKPCGLSVTTSTPACCALRMMVRSGSSPPTKSSCTSERGSPGRMRRTTTGWVPTMRPGTSRSSSAATSSSCRTPITNAEPGW